MVYAIFVVLLLAGIAVYSLSISAQSTKVQTDEHARIQMGLYMDSAIELTLLWLSENQGRSWDNPAVAGDESSRFNIQFNNRGASYDVNVTCWKIPDTDNPENNGTVIMDLNGSTDDATLTGETLRMTRRTVQKP